MQDRALTIVDNNLPVVPMSAAAIQDQVNAIQQVLRGVMKEDVHYGVIPGTKSPTLYKPGAEKIMATFRLSADPEIEDLSTPDEYRYRVKVILRSPTGAYLGAGIGECSTVVEKYKWSACYIQKELEATDEARKRVKYSQYKGKVKEVNQIRTNPADLANTVLKMAKKRALVDAVLTTTAASDIFTQDIEDLPPEYVADMEKRKQGSAPAPVEQPKQKASECLLTDNQVGILRGKLKGAGKTEKEFYLAFGIGHLSQLYAGQLNDAIAWMQE